jgi:hypothetical protein
MVESRGIDAAATITPERVSKKRACSQSWLVESGSRKENSTSAAVGGLPPFTARRTW